MSTVDKVTRHVLNNPNLFESVWTCNVDLVCSDVNLMSSPAFVVCLHMHKVDPMGKRKVLAVTSINMVRYASSLPFDHDLHLRLKPVSCKIKKVILQVSINSIFLREGKAT